MSWMHNVCCNSGCRCIESLSVFLLQEATLVEMNHGYRALEADHPGHEYGANALKQKGNLAER